MSFSFRFQTLRFTNPTLFRSHCWLIQTKPFFFSLTLHKANSLPTSDLLRFFYCSVYWGLLFVCFWFVFTKVSNSIHICIISTDWSLGFSIPGKVLEAVTPAGKTYIPFQIYNGVPSLCQWVLIVASSEKREMKANSLIIIYFNYQPDKCFSFLKKRQQIL